MAVLGYENNNGKFEVEDYCLGGLPYQESPKLDEPLTKGEDRQVVHNRKNILENHLPFLLILLIKGELPQGKGLIT